MESFRQEAKTASWKMPHDPSRIQEWLDDKAFEHLTYGARETYLAQAKMWKHDYKSFAAEQKALRHSSRKDGLVGDAMSNAQSDLYVNSRILRVMLAMRRAMKRNAQASYLASKSVVA